jgi:hypothetical protein
MKPEAKAVRGSYARAVERLWTALCGRAVILSPRDWGIVKEWYERGIPLQIIEEAIDAAAERRSEGRQTAPPRGLAYIAPAVEEGWLALLEGGRGGAEDQDSPAPEERGNPLSGWRELLGRETEGSALSSLLAGLLEEFEQGEDRAELDRRLDEGLPGAAPAELLREIELELQREIEPYRERMTPEIYETTLRRALAMRLRLRLGLERLSQ